MRNRISINSTNVRFGGIGGPTLAIALWWAFVSVLASTRALATLASDVPMVAGFASAVALLAYAVDAELRGAVECRPVGVWLAIAIACIALCATHAAMLLALSPIAAVCVVAAATRRHAPAVSSAPAASPGASRGAL